METAKRLIAKYGLDVDLVIFADVVVVDVEKPWRVDSLTSIVQTVRGVFLGYEKRLIDGTLIQQNDKRVLIAALGLTDAPNLRGEIRSADGKWRIISIKQLAPAGNEILYTVQVRQ